MQDNDYYDPNILSHQYLPLVEPRYDFVVVDEVQDLTTIQLQLILTSLREPHQFVLCGDANQIVHPNFFSWSTLKRFFYQHDGRTGAGRPDSDSPQQLPQRRRHHRSREPHVETETRPLWLRGPREQLPRPQHGRDVRDRAAAGRHASRSPANSIRKHTSPPILPSSSCTRSKNRRPAPISRPRLIFSIQEAKGLEYDNIILYNFTSGCRRALSGNHPWRQCGGRASGGTHAMRGRGTKAISRWKCTSFILTRCMSRSPARWRTSISLRPNPDQRLFEVLGLQRWEERLALAEHGSSLDEWRQEARRLELQGKQEQADAIRTQILKLKDVPWEVLHGETLRALEQQAFEHDDKQAKLLLFEYALVYQDHTRMQALAETGFRPATQPEKGIKPLTQKYFFPYELKKPEAMLRQVDQYGVDFRNPFNQTPLMIAARLGNDDQVGRLVAMGADTGLINNVGFNAFHIVLEQACMMPTTRPGNSRACMRTLAPTEHGDPGGRTAGEAGQPVDGVSPAQPDDRHVLHPPGRPMWCASAVGAFSSGDFVEVLHHFPDTLVPARRKQRAYISSILSKNEVDRDDPYNRKLFRRLKHGHYIINPQLAVWVEGAWRNMYDLLSLDALGYRRREPHHFYSFDPNAHMQDQLHQFKTLVKQLRDGEEVASGSSATTH